LRGLATVVGFLVGGLAIGAVALLAAGRDPVAAYGAMVEGAFGSRFAIGETLARAAPLAVIGVGVSVALRGGVFTIGAEGQLILGALGATVASFWLREAPQWVVIPTASVASGVFGALWALPPALLKAHLRVNEILSTLLFNYFAGFLLAYLLRGPLRPPNSPISQSDVLPPHAVLPRLVPGSRLHVGVLLALVVIGGFALWVRSVKGFRVDLFGQNPILARQLGVSPGWMVTGVMVVSGALAGVAGWAQVAGLHRRLYLEVASGVGFLGILVAVLGGLRPLGVLGASLLLAGLQAGGVYMEQTASVPATLSDVVQALVLLGFAARLGPRLWQAARSGARKPGPSLAEGGVAALEAPVAERAGEAGEGVRGAWRS
jgi:ABC-type uncharacterized transport system permease subunit